MPSNSVWSGPRPGFCTSQALTSAYLSTGTPPTSPSNAFASIALSILENEWIGSTVASLPPATMYSPVGSTSTPCGDLGVGRKYTSPGQPDGSSTVTSRRSSCEAAWVASSSMLWA